MAMPLTTNTPAKREIDFVLLRHKLAAGERRVGLLHAAIQPASKAGA